MRVKPKRSIRSAKNVMVITRLESFSAPGDSFVSFLLSRFPCSDIFSAVIFRHALCATREKANKRFREEIDW